MFCPKCNQQQASDTMRFCSRCGFPLEAVAILLHNDGLIPAFAPEPAQKQRYTRKTIMIESASFTLIVWIVGLLATFWFDAGGPFETIAKIAALLFSILGLIGVLRFLYGFVFAKDLADQPTLDARAGLTSRRDVTLGSPRPFVLSPHQDQPEIGYSQRGNTNEMVPRPSVTENTTRLLEEQGVDRSE